MLRIKKIVSFLWAIKNLTWLSKSIASEEISSQTLKV